MLALAMFMREAQSPDEFLVRNYIPLVVATIAPIVVLIANRGRWFTPHLPAALAAWFFALVVFGLNLYVHSLWFYDVDGLQSEATQPGLLFRYLPLYTLGSAAIGAAIGWIVGRHAQNVREHRP